MIIVKENKRYLSSLDLKAIEQGIAELGIHSLNFDRYYTEEQKEQNRQTAQSMTNEQWNQRCEQARIEIGNKIETIIDEINDNFTVYQYKDKKIDYSNDDWDLFFWCNMTKDWTARDMSYVKLNPNKKRINEQQLLTIGSVIGLIKNIQMDGIQVSIQYKAIYDEEKADKLVLDYCKKMKDQFIEYSGQVGKIVDFNGRYIFKKKGAKKHGYEINPSAVLANVFS